MTKKSKKTFFLTCTQLPPPDFKHIYWEVAATVSTWCNYFQPTHRWQGGTWKYTKEIFFQHRAHSNWYNCPLSLAFLSCPPPLPSSFQSCEKFSCKLLQCQFCVPLCYTGKKNRFLVACFPSASWDDDSSTILDEIQSANKRADWFTYQHVFSPSDSQGSEMWKIWRFSLKKSKTDHKLIHF